MPLFFCAEIFFETDFGKTILTCYCRRFFGRCPQNDGRTKSDKTSECERTRKQEIFDGTTKTKSESEVKKIDRPKIQDSEAKYLFSEFFR